MRIASCLVLCVTFSSSGVFAKTLVTSSEENHARICTARQVDAPRIVSACDVALSDARLTQSQRVDMLVARGDGHLWQNQNQAAVTSYRAALSIDERAVDAWNGLGWALWEVEGDQAAYEAFVQSVALDVSVQGLGGKAATARRLGLVTGQEARDMLTAALSIDPDYIWAVREIGWSHLDEGDYSAAADQFLAALDIDPDDINGRYGLARAKLGMGEAEDALARLNDVLADSPRDFPALVYRVIALRDLDRNAQALREADRLIASHPQRASGYIERGQALIALERRSEAIKTYKDADAKIGPNNAILYWYADALTVDGKFQEALGVIDRGLRLDGADYSDHLLRSYIALELGDYGLARKAAEDSLATGIEDPWAHYYLAIVHVNEGNSDQALASFDRAMASGLPTDRVGAFASELIGAGNYVEATQLRLKY